MKCEICGKDACYMVAVDSTLSAVAKQHVRAFAGRCKKCVDEKDVPNKASRTAKAAKPGTPYERLRNAL